MPTGSYCGADRLDLLETLRLGQAVANLVNVLDPEAVVIGGGLGLARWHPRETAQMMRWPTGMAAGNHWALLA